MAFSKSELPQRECHEFANSANKPKKICEIRPHLHLAQVQVFALFAFQIGHAKEKIYSFTFSSKNLTTASINWYHASLMKE